MDDIMQILEDELAARPDEIPAERPKQEFQIDTKEKAEWLVGKMSALDAKENLVRGQYKAIVKDIENDRRFLEWRFGNQLESWARTALERGKKSVKLLTGTLRFRKCPARLDIVDDAAALAWAEKNCPGSIVVRKEVSKTELKKYLDMTGEIPPGCEVIAERESFSIGGAE